MNGIGIAGFLHESNTFLPIPTTYELFEQASFTRGSEVLERWRGTQHELGGFIEGMEACGLSPVPLLATYAVPSGKLTADTFERIANELTEAIRNAGALDGILIALHGATVADKYPDADGEILARLRTLVGPQIPIVNTLDLHANVSQRMVTNATATVIYRSNPHLDQRERGREAAEIIARCVAGEIHPVQWLETPPLVINMGRQYTSESPAREIYADVTSVASRPGMISASAAMGFYYADVAELGASFLAVADGDLATAREGARWMAGRAWGRRHEFQAELPSSEAAVRRAGAASSGPIVLMDVGDNVGGGSPGDSTILFAEILRQRLSDALVILYDPEAVNACVQAGVRQTIEIEVGGKTDNRHGKPVLVRGAVRIISDGRFVETRRVHAGWGEGDQGVTAVLETEERHTIVLTSRRMAPFALEQILSLGIHPERKRAIVVKGVIAPRAAYEPVAAEIILVNTPGLTCADPKMFEYASRRQPLFPLEADADYTG